MEFRIFIVFCLMTFFITEAKATETKVNEQKVTELGELYHFSEDIYKITSKVDPVSDKFYITTEEADRIKANALLEEEIATYAFSINTDDSEFTSSPCIFDELEIKDKISLQNKIKERESSIFFMGSFTDKKAVALAEGVYGKANYNTFMSNLYSKGVNSASSISTLSSLESEFLKQADSTLGWDSLSVLEKAKLLKSFASKVVNSDVSLGLILSEYSINSLISDPSSWKKNISELKDHLSFSEKVKLASHMGGLFSSDYNYDRSNEVGDTGKGIVTIEQMLEALSSDDSGGICRDVALAQSQILQELGIKKESIFMISYKTVDNRHVTLALEDPDNKGNIVKINYSYINEENDVKGAAALTQDSSLPGLGMKYNIYDSEGNSIAIVPTEIEQIFDEVTEGTYHKRNIAKTYSLNRVGVNTPYGSGSMFAGTTSAGDNIVGVALNSDLKIGPVDVDYGIVGAQRKSTRSLYSIDQDTLYGRLRTKMNSTDVKVGDHFSVSAYGGSELRAMYMDNEVIENSAMLTSIKGTNSEASLFFFAGGEASWKSKDDKIKIDTEIEASSYLDYNNVVTPDEGLGVISDNVRWTTGIQKKVSKEMSLMGQGTIVMYNMGSSAIISGGISDEKSNLSAKASYQTPLDDLPSFMPGAAKTVAASITKRLSKKKNENNLKFTLEYLHDLDFNDDRVNANLEWKFK